MLSFLKGKQQIREYLASRNLSGAPSPQARKSQRVVARWPRERLRQLTRRFKASQRAEPGDVLLEKWETIHLP